MRRNSGPSFRNSGAYTSPGTPDYNDHLPKTWSSERMPLHTSSRRHLSGAASMPFNSGRPLPSKWDDAERWITSPVSGYGAFNAVAVRPQRRSRSKSGPLPPMGLVYMPNYSPNMPLHQGRSLRNFMANSPLTTGVLLPEGLSVHYEARSNLLYSEENGKHATSMLSETSDPTSEDEEDDGGKEEEEEEAMVLCRDMATQMSPQRSSHSSPKGRLSFSTLRPSFEHLHRNSVPAGKDDIRDVQVDKGTNACHGLVNQGVEEEREVGDVPASWNVVTHSTKNMSKLQREEAKITAWENLQKAKAEAAVRKLEMKLEKKRSASMDKITNKLHDAEAKARAMRNSLSSISDQPKTSRKRRSCFKYFKICCICNCLLCTKR